MMHDVTLNNKTSQFERHLFLGVTIDTALQEKLQALNPELVAIYIRDDYLQEFSFQSQRYLGRTLSSPSQISDIEMVETHIFSLLKRLLPDYPFNQTKLWLLPHII